MNKQAFAAALAALALIFLAPQFRAQANAAASTPQLVILATAIGPLFNIQAAITQDPAAFRQLKRVVLMGGSVYRGYDKRAAASTGTSTTSAASAYTRTPPSPEWNILCDPAGAQALFASGVP